MAIAKKCDLCGKFYERYNEARDDKRPNGFKLISIDPERKFYDYGAIDCCPDCMGSILQYIERLKGAGND